MIIQTFPMCLSDYASCLDKTKDGIICPVLMKLLSFFLVMEHLPIVEILCSVLDVIEILSLAWTTATQHIHLYITFSTFPTEITAGTVTCFTEHHWVQHHHLIGILPAFPRPNLLLSDCIHTMVNILPFITVAVFSSNTLSTCGHQQIKHVSLFCAITKASCEQLSTADW